MKMPNNPNSFVEMRFAIEPHGEKHFTEVIPCCRFVIMTNCSRTEKQKKLRKLAPAVESS